MQTAARLHKIAVRWHEIVERMPANVVRLSYKPIALVIDGWQTALWVEGIPCKNHFSEKQVTLLQPHRKLWLTDQSNVWLLGYCNDILNLS